MARRPRAKPTAPAVPAWVPDADRLLASAARRIRVVGASTPLNLAEELARLVATWARSGGEAPRFTYAPAQDHRELRKAMEMAAERLAREGELGALYAGRALEIAADAAICEGAGGSACWAAARRRYAPRDEFDAEADALAAGWLDELSGADAAEGEPARGRGQDERARGGGPGGRARGRGQGGRALGSGDGERVMSDDERSPLSLVSRMRSEIGAQRLPLRVVVADIAPLAATGDGIIQVARGRLLTRDDVERTVLHEIEGHAAPAVRAAALPLGIFAIGTAHGGDDQEGWALACERAAGYLRGARRRELGLRHLAARSVERGAGFVETARLLEARGAPSIGDALRITARVHRGGGLGREVVYLPALLRVEAALRERPALEQVLASGRIAVSAAEPLSSWASAVAFCAEARRKGPA